MNLFIIFFAVMGLIGITTGIEAFETICSDSEDIELDYTVTHGKVLESCIDEFTPTVFMTVESDTASQITVEIPRTMVYSINQGCESLDLMIVVLVNGEETDSTIQTTPSSRIFTLDFPAGYNAIEFIGTFTLGDDVHQYCGVIYGYDSQYLPPEIQVEKGRVPEHVRCNEGLELTVIDNVPMCVVDPTLKKLVTNEYDGIYDLSFVTPIMKGEVEKYVIIGELTIENGIISSVELEDHYLKSYPVKYSGSVYNDDTAHLTGPCIEEGEGHYDSLQFVDGRFVGDVECDSSIPIPGARVTLIPTGGDFLGFTKVSLIKIIAEDEVRDYDDQGGGCLIATATFGSELASQVQQLRELRDNSLLRSESGTNFMESFNQFYYSFSPMIADYERENPLFKEAVKLVITPMISSLSILNYVDMDSEESVLGYGISLILLNIGMYFIAPVIIIRMVWSKI
ncbi:CFI-box-CTERM domain-containing protein [Nitrosopumilus ureiphilus]|uniref:CFI-box-CTERM domain-containing protein n=1 Tax=Nitrosopumilus ureiphilus TaxID=1470067 RepID=UPI001FE5D1B6|nr:CFI-box-CTERM domain-containing protein [Nitrosopumilus ureiphilus]